MENPIEAYEFDFLLHSGDILVCRASSLMGVAIEQITKSQYTHAAMVAKMWQSDDRLWIAQAETVQHNAARLIDLKQEIEKWPGLYDCYRVKTRFNRHTAVRFMLESAGSCYGWKYIWAVWLRRRLGRWIPAIKNSDDPKTNRDCSGLVHAALRAGGGPQLADYDCDVAPGDLAASDQLQYIGTLYPNTSAEEAR